MAELSPETLAWLRQTAKFDGAVTAQALLHLLERVEALEQRSTCAESAQVDPTPEAAPVATENGLLRCYGQAMEDAVKRGASHDEAKEAGRRACYNLGRQHAAAPQAPTDKELLAMRSWSNHGPTFDSDLVDFGRRCYNLARQPVSTPYKLPAPVAPTDEELLESAVKALGYKSIPSDGSCMVAEPCELLDFARTVLARWGRQHGAAQPGTRLTSYSVGIAKPVEEWGQGHTPVQSAAAQPLDRTTPSQPVNLAELRDPDFSDGLTASQHLDVLRGGSDPRATATAAL